MSFRNKALIGYMAVVLPLTAVMAVTIGRLNSSASEQVARLRVEENEISLAQALRSDAELLVSAGRGYLIAGAPGLLLKLRQSEVSFDESLAALEEQTLSPTAIALMQEVERAARAFGEAQAGIMEKRRQLEQNAELIERFEAKLLPLSTELRESLERLVAYKEELLERDYLDARRDRTNLAVFTYLVLGTLTLMGVGLAWGFAGLLDRSYRKERDALQRAQQALTMRDELMGIVAHDLRNPLNAIALKAAVLRQGGNSDKLCQQAASIEQVTKTMAELINSMLDASTLRAGCFSVTPAVCDARGLLSEALETFANVASSKHVCLEQDAEAEVTLLADRERVLQVLSNLLGNALKVTPRGGRVGICLEQQDRVAHFAVWDTGPGISEEHLPHIFARRWKHDSGGMNGTGLGLFIAKGIIDAHGGRIWVDTKQGCGARFHFTLPLAEGPTAS